MPLTCHQEEFLAKVQKNHKIQIPKILRWKHKLDPGELLDVRIESVELEEESFTIKLTKDFRFTIPALVAEICELKTGSTVRVTLTNIK